MKLQHAVAKKNFSLKRAIKLKVKYEPAKKASTQKINKIHKFFRQIFYLKKVLGCLFVTQKKRFRILHPEKRANAKSQSI